jgi:hypothetical protein
VLIQDSVTGGLAAASQAKMVSSAWNCDVVSYATVRHTLKEDTKDAALKITAVQIVSGSGQK